MPTSRGPDGRRERLDVDDDDVDQADLLRLELGELLGDVAPGEDPGVDGGMERLDLAADEWRHVGQLRDRRDLDAVAGEVLARPVGREDLDAEGEQVSGEGRRSRRGWRPTAGLAPGASSHPRTPAASRRGPCGVAPRPVAWRRTAPAEYSARMAYSGGAIHASDSIEVARDAPALGVPLPAVQPAQLPGPLHPDLGRRRSSCWSVLVILYNVRTRALHRHAPYLELWEWLLWTGLITFGLSDRGSLFVFDFFVVLVIFIVGLGDAVWIRFLRFPPMLEAYEARLARAALLHEAEVRATPSRRSEAGGRRRRAQR